MDKAFKIIAEYRKGDKTLEETISALCMQCNLREDEAEMFINCF